MEEQIYKNDQEIPAEQTDEVAESLPKKKRRWLKIIIWIFGILVFLVVLFFSIPYALSLIWGKDIPLPNDQDLLLSVVDIPKEENSYFDLIKFSQIIGREINKEAEINIDIPNDVNDLEYLESYDWEISIVEELLSMNEEALQVFSEAASKPQFQLDIIADPVNISPYMPVIGLNKWRQIARISSIKAIYLMRQGNDEAAFEEALKIIKIGYDIEISKNLHTIAYLVGIAIKQTGLLTMQSLIGYSSASPEILSKHQEKNRKYKAVNNTDFLRAEYMSFKKSLEYVNDSSVDDFETYLSKHNYYYKPNKTLELAAEHYRKEIERYILCFDKTIITFNMPKVSWRLYFTENAVGKSLASLGVVAMGSVHNKKCGSDALLKATDILFALKKYRIENNSYPESLQNLVPTYTRELPNDPFSGQLFHYDLDNMILYSIGADYIDDGGSDLEKESFILDEPTFSYDFIVTESKVDLQIDSDQDGLSDAKEISLGTDPQNPDTDGDGFLDGDEVTKGYNPNGSGMLNDN